CGERFRWVPGSPREARFQERVSLTSCAAAFRIERGVSTRGELAERVALFECRQAHADGRPWVPLRQISRHLVKPSPSAFDVGAGKRAEELVASVADDKVV